MSLERMSKRIFTDSFKNPHIGIVDVNGNGVRLQVLDENNNNCWTEGVKYKCQRCGKVSSIKLDTFRFYKRNHLLCRSCASAVSSMDSEKWKNYENTMNEKYGFSRPIQNPEIRKRTERTWGRLYGVDSPLKSKKIQDKIKTTCIRKYGVDNPFKLKEFQEKADETWIRKYGSSNLLETDIGKGIRKKDVGVSKVQMKFFREFEQKIRESCLYGENEYRISDGEKYYHLDCYIPLYKVGIEFQDDYFHANPELFKSDDIVGFESGKTTAQDVWLKDDTRYFYLSILNGIKIFYVWENDYRKDPKGTVSKIVKEVKKYVRKNRRIGHQS